MPLQARGFLAPPPALCGIFLGGRISEPVDATRLLPGTIIRSENDQHLVFQTISFARRREIRNKTDIPNTTSVAASGSWEPSSAGAEAEEGARMARGGASPLRVSSEPSRASYLMILEAVEGGACREGVVLDVEPCGFFGEAHVLRLARLGVGVEGPATEAAGEATVALDEGSVLIAGIR